MSDAALLSCPACGAPVGPNDTVCPYCQATLATITCPKCFGFAFKGAKNCPHCGAALEAAAERKAAETCPGCKSQMESQVLGGYAMDVCGHCASIWIARDTFEAFCKDQEKQAVVVEALPKVDAPPINALSQGYRPCPDCKQLMNRVNFAQISGVILDACKAHGTFFDPDELRRLVAFLQGGGMDRARSRQMDALKAEQQRLQDQAASMAGGMDAGADWSVGRSSNLGDFLEQGLTRFLFDRFLH
ncbi:MAG: zf-TFIIB domain-containing protein [Acidobacteria bacterium]|nr:zf-TFIIB domain-containing protein [Acidobacteriota bacterium]